MRNGLIRSLMTASLAVSAAHPGLLPPPAVKPGAAPAPSSERVRHACAPTDAFVDRPHRLPFENTDPRLGQHVEVVFDVRVQHQHRIIIKQDDQVVARFHGNAGASPHVVRYDSPGGEILYEVAQYHGDQWRALVAPVDDPPDFDGDTTSTIRWGTEGSVTITFGPGIVRAPRGGPPEPIPAAAGADPGRHRFDEVYYVLRHNTYEHESRLTDWLDHGLRAVEIDIADVGDWEDDANGPLVSHDGSEGDRNCSGNPDRIGHCLRDIAAWLDTRPGEGPVLVFVDLKTKLLDPANDWKASEVLLLDDRIFGIVGSRLYTSGDLYRHATGAPYAPGGRTLRSAVSEQGWPRLADLRGRIIVAYTGGRHFFVNQTQGAGIEEITGNAGRLPFGFFCPDVEADPDELQPGGTVTGIAQATSQHVVCGNLEAGDHYQVTASRAAAHRQIIHLHGDHVFGNGDFPFSYIAVAHGVSVIGRDVNVTETYGGFLPLVGVRRSVPGYFELRPMHVQGKCMEARGAGAGNGTRIVLADCAGRDHQRFVYTAEGQLRPRHVNPACVDIDGGDAEADAAVHLWNCDGGRSEKWSVDPAGTFRSVDDRQYCLDVSGSGSANGTPFITSRCHGGNNQRFTLTPVPEWPQTQF